MGEVSSAARRRGSPKHHVRPPSSPVRRGPANGGTWEVPNELRRCGCASPSGCYGLLSQRLTTRALQPTWAHLKLKPLCWFTHRILPRSSGRGITRNVSQIRLWRNGGGFSPPPAPTRRRPVATGKAKRHPWTPSPTPQHPAPEGRRNTRITLFSSALHPQT